jgi:hypothetical protein
MSTDPRLSSTFRAATRRAGAAAATCVKQTRTPIHVAFLITASLAELALTLAASAGIVLGLLWLADLLQ